jgi:hypothetical protein
MRSFPLAFSLTLVMEAAVLVALHSRERTLGRILATALGANTLTHPLVFLVLPRFFDHWGTYLVVAEAFALFVEAPVLWLGLRPEPGLRALSSSALANGASYLLGMALIGWGA